MEAASCSPTQEDHGLRLYASNDLLDSPQVLFDAGNLALVPETRIQNTMAVLGGQPSTGLAEKQENTRGPPVRWRAKFIFNGRATHQSSQWLAKCAWLCPPFVFPFPRAPVDQLELTHVRHYAENGSNIQRQRDLSRLSTSR